MTFLTTELSFSNELIVVLSVLYCLTFIALLAICLCGCRKGSPKNDLLGLDGMVKITNPDENVNHLPAVGKYFTQNKDDSAILDLDDINKRPSGGSNPHRSLPDIPIYADGDAPGSDNGVSGDTSSDLYATVEDKISNSFNNPGSHNRHSLPNGVHSRAGISSSIRQTDNYARVRENPYDKVKKTENPYAKVQTDDGNEEISRENSPSTPHTSNVAPNGSVTEPVAPPRSRRSSLQNSLILTATNTCLPSSTADIPAATAVAGRVAASQDLPYMTPPITVPQPDVANVVQQQHFSGDSQDSSKGYTSISVREPLEHIRSQTKALRTRKDDIDPHYATVSDDSDDNMYAAIVEPNSQIYNGSETYAQIQPVTIVEVHGHASPAETNDETDIPAPELPNVNMKHVIVHSRQASSSSCTSSVANIGSPKPEKRQANSPLPPTPAVSPDMYARVDKNHSRENSRGSITVARNLEDMYAKVQKNKRKSEDDDKSMNTSTSDINTSYRSYTPDMNITSNPKTNHHLDSHSRQSWSSKDSFDENKHIEDMYEYSSDSDIALDLKNSKRKADINEHCYETLNKSGKSTSPGKVIIDPHEIGYEKIRDNNWLSPELNNISGPESLISNDPGYEQLNHHSRVSSEIDPNYEILRPHRTSSLSGSSVGYSRIATNNKSTLTVKSDYETMPSSSKEDGYSVVNKLRKERIDPGYEELNNQCIEEPNYESMPSECDNYATVHQKSTESESDPNYESVKYLDVTLSEPPYERLNDDENKESDEYEPISSKQSSHMTPDYERIKGTSSKSSSNSNDRTISDGTFSNGTDEEDNRKEGGNTVNINVVKCISPRSSVDVDINLVDVHEIIENNEEHMYFQV